MSATDDELRRLAEAATPGPWHFGLKVVGRTDDAHVDAWVCALGGGICEMSGMRGIEVNAAFIAAANPAAVLALLDRLRGAEARGMERAAEIVEANSIDLNHPTRMIPVPDAMRGYRDRVRHGYGDAIRAAAAALRASAGGSGDER
jgi:hypothetical protein